MATELKKVFKDDKKYCDKQEKIFEAIDKYDIEVILKEYFTKHTNGKKYGKSGGERGRFAGLGWRELVFNEAYKETFKPYTGVQIYLYAVDENEIGNISDEALERNNEINKSGKINEFPYDGPPSTRNQRLVSDNVQIDTNTGNLIKKDNSFTKAQIWFCIKNEKDNCVYVKEALENDKPKGFDIIIDKFDKVKNNKKLEKSEFCESVKDYFAELKRQKLVSESIDLDCGKDEIGKRVEDKIINLINERRIYLKGNNE